MSGSREQILTRISEALRAPAPKHGSGQGGHSGLPAQASPGFREWLPLVGESAAERLALFRKQCDALRAEVVECADAAAAASELGALARGGQWRRIAMHPGPLATAVTELLGPVCDLVKIERGYEKELLEACDAGVTDCECLVAQTGSVCVTSNSSGGRALSVLPPHHIVVARKSQLEPDLTAAYALLASRYPRDYPSFISFVTGPSRTGDIERILVLGAHGPKRLTILLLDSP